LRPLDKVGPSVAHFVSTTAILDKNQPTDNVLSAVNLTLQIYHRQWRRPNDQYKAYSKHITSAIEAYQMCS